MRRAALGLMAASLLLAGGALPAAAFAVKFSWAGIAACSSASSAFTFAEVPAGTARLRFTLHDKDAPDFVHGGAAVDYAGSARVPAGAFTYTSPCPPPGIIMSEPSKPSTPRVRCSGKPNTAQSSKVGSDSVWP